MQETQATAWRGANTLADTYLSALAFEADVRREAMARWGAVWRASRIRHAVESVESLLGWDSMRAAPSLTVPYPLSGRPAVGDVVAVREGDAPDAGNQHLRRIDGVGPSSTPGMAVLVLGPALPRREWPQAMRAATAPTGLWVRCSGDAVQLVDPAGEVAARFAGEPGKARLLAAHVAGLVEDMARLGLADAAAGRRRALDARPGQGGKGHVGRTWQVVDDAGAVHEAEPRGLLERRPPRCVESLLLAARLAYADGHAEAGLAARADMAGDEEPERAPRPAP